MHAGAGAVCTLSPAYAIRAIQLPAMLPSNQSTMTADNFRTIALSFPEAVEAQHMGHPDFRVDGKIFATLGPGEEWGMVKLTPDQQSAFQTRHPHVFSPASAAWGKRGATIIRLS